MIYKVHQLQNESDFRIFNFCHSHRVEHCRFTKKPHFFYFFIFIFEKFEGSKAKNSIFQKFHFFSNFCNFWTGNDIRMIFFLLFSCLSHKITLDRLVWKKIRLKNGNFFGNFWWFFFEIFFVSKKFFTARNFSNYFKSEIYSESP